MRRDDETIPQPAIPQPARAAAGDRAIGEGSAGAGGARSGIEVVVYYRGVRQRTVRFDSPRDGRLGARSVTVTAVGVILACVGIGAVVSQIWSVRQQQRYRREMRAFVAARDLPARFVPEVRSSGVVELVGGGFFLLGLVAVVLGGVRARDELRNPALTIGEHPASVYPTPGEALPAGGQRPFPLLRSDGRAFRLGFTAQMWGHVRWGTGETRSLDTLVTEGRAHPLPNFPGGFDLILPPHVHCGLGFGDLAFVVNSPDPSPR